MLTLLGQKRWDLRSPGGTVLVNQLIPVTWFGHACRNIVNGE